MDKIKVKSNLLRWLYPGIRVKRFIFISALGLLFSSISLLIIVLESSFSVKKELSTHLLIKWFGITPSWLSFSIAILFLILGIYGIVYGIQKTVQGIFGTLTKKDYDEIKEGFYTKKLLDQGPEIVVIGGGTGLSTLLRGLKDYTSNLTAIVTAADDGGSSGRIRKEWGLVPPGDIRNCLLALADTEPLMNALFDYRFETGEGLQGHNFGNLFILAMTEITGDFETAVQEFSRVLNVRGQVMASTLNNVNLKATYENGEEIIGESSIVKKGKKISKVGLIPPECSPNPLALEALKKADLIVLGPGSLYTSIMPNLLVPGIVSAIKEKGTPVLYVVNVMTEPGETISYSASDHLRVILEHTKTPNLIDYVLVNVGDFDLEIKKRYEKEGAYPVFVDQKDLESLGVKVIKKHLVNSNDFARHDPDKLATSIMNICFKLAFRAKDS